MHFIDAFSERAKNYLQHANDNPVYPSQTAVLDLEQLNTGLQEQSIDPSEVLALLDDVGSPATVKSTGGR